MHPNLSSTERWVRGVAGTLAVYMGTVTMGAGGWSTFAWAFGGFVLLTAVAGYCPVYDRLGYNSLNPDGNYADADSSFRSVASGDRIGNRTGNRRSEGTGGEQDNRSQGGAPGQDGNAPNAWQRWDDVYRRGGGRS